MRSWIVRFAALYVFNVVVLLLIGLLTPAKVGFAVIWAALIMTLAELWVRPFVQRRMQASAAKSAGTRTRTGEALVQAGIVLIVAALVWALTLLLSGVHVSIGWNPLGWIGAWIVPPVIIALGGLVYARISGRIETHAGAVYDRAEAGIRGSRTADRGTDAVGTASGEARADDARARGRQELDDGLTAEQRRMLDDLG